MNREIKFRAWDSSMKHMHDEVYISGYGGVFTNASKFYDTPNTEIEHADNLIVMQFTGLKDKHDVEIYEGDIVLCKISIEVDADSKDFSYYNQKQDGTRAKVCCKPKPSTVEFCDGGIVYQHISGKRCTSWLTKASEVEVIGNMHENPELLEANTNE